MNKKKVRLSLVTIFKFLFGTSYSMHYISETEPEHYILRLEWLLKWERVGFFVSLLRFPPTILLPLPTKALFSSRPFLKRTKSFSVDVSLSVVVCSLPIFATWRHRTTTTIVAAAAAAATSSLFTVAGPIWEATHLVGQLFAPAGAQQPRHPPLGQLVAAVVVTISLPLSIDLRGWSSLCCHASLLSYCCLTRCTIASCLCFSCFPLLVVFALLPC